MLSDVNKYIRFPIGIIDHLSRKNNIFTYIYTDKYILIKFRAQIGHRLLKLKKIYV